MAAPLSLWNISAAWVRHRLARSVVGFVAWLLRVLRCAFARAADAVRRVASSQWPWTRWLGGGESVIHSSRSNAPASFASEALIAIADALAAVGRQFGSLIAANSTVDRVSSVPPSLSPQRPPHATTALRALFDLLRAAFRAVFGLLWRRRGALFRGTLILALSLSVAHRVRLLVVRSGAFRDESPIIDCTNHGPNHGRMIATHLVQYVFAPFQRTHRNMAQTVDQSLQPLTTTNHSCDKQDSRDSLA